MKNLLVTGYRAHELGVFDNKHKGIPYIKKAMTSRLIPLIEDGVQWIITPGQYGVDLWACEAAIELKQTYPQLKCSIITAFQQQEERWSDDKKDYYLQLVKQLDYYGAVSHQPYIGSWQFIARDELLFRKTDGILLVYDEDANEGSPRFVKERALKKHQTEGYGYICIGSDEIQAAAMDMTDMMDDLPADAMIDDHAEAEYDPFND